MQIAGHLIAAVTNECGVLEWLQVTFFKHRIIVSNSSKTVFKPSKDTKLENIFSVHH